MEKLSIREASQTFGISRARLYQLLDKGVIVGHLSGSHAGGSWVSLASMRTHIETRNEKWGQGRPKVLPDGEKYLPVREAAKKTGYSTRHVYLLISQGAVASKYGDTGKLVYYPDLLAYKNNR
jgi:predicted DNA-binding transcriptional regulator AlpA